MKGKKEEKKEMKKEKIFKSQIPDIKQNMYLLIMISYLMEECFNFSECHQRRLVFLRWSLVAY